VVSSESMLRWFRLVLLVSALVSMRTHATAAPAP
jgi:hypothetical protein